MLELAQVIKAATPPSTPLRMTIFAGMVELLLGQFLDIRHLRQAGFVVKPILAENCHVATDLPRVHKG